MFGKEKSLFQLLQQKNQYFTGQDSLQSGPAWTPGILEKWNDDDKKSHMWPWTVSVSGWCRHLKGWVNSCKWKKAVDTATGVLPHADTDPQDWISSVAIQWGKKGSIIQNQNTTPLCNAKDGAQETSSNSLENVVGKGKITFKGKAQRGEGNKEERELVREKKLSNKSRPHVHWGFAPC